jgi:DNA polymerase
VSAPDPRDVARFLRQRQEAGMPALFLESLDRAEAAALVRGATRPSAAGVPPRVGAGPSPGRTAVAGAFGGAPAAPEPPAPRRAATPAPVPPPAPAVSARSSGELPMLDYERLRDTALVCTRCGLAEGRTQVVFSDGNPDGRVMVVGEAPGANEDRTGLPFVGAAGKLLDLMLASVDLSRADSVYICNVLKCRPPGNRNPLPDEIEACSPYLRRQIELVRPEAILAVGTFSAQLLTGSQAALGNLRGSVYSYEGVPLVVTYHPAALLRNPSWSRPTWDDLQLLRRVLDGS